MVSSHAVDLKSNQILAGFSVALVVFKRNSREEKKIAIYSFRWLVYYKCMNLYANFLCCVTCRKYLWSCKMLIKKDLKLRKRNWYLKKNLMRKERDSVLKKITQTIFCVVFRFGSMSMKNVLRAHYNCIWHLKRFNLVIHMVIIKK